MKTNKTTKKTAKYDYRDTYDDDHKIAVVGKGGKFGYINHRGKEITPLKYDCAKRFYWDVGKVQLNGKWGLVNRQGKEITPTIYDEIKGHQDPIVRIGDKYGFVNRKTGELLTPVKYDHAEQWIQILNFASLKFGKKDLAKVRLGDKWGCVNVRGEEIAPLKYEQIEINQTETPNIAAKLDGKWGFIGENGKEVTAFEYDDLEEFYNYRARVKKEDKYGFINTNGIVVIPLIYDDCESRFQNTFPDDDSEKHIFPIWVKHGDKYGFIDISGKEKIKPIYENVKPFNHFDQKTIMAAVVLNGAAGFIDETGEIVIPLMYEPDFDDRYNYMFYNGFANVRYDGKWGVIDTQNRVVIPFRYDEFILNQCAGFRYAIRDGKKLSIDAKGNEWEMKKNPAARTFRDYVHAVTWTEVEKSFRTLILVIEEDNDEVEQYLKIYEENFNNFRNKQFKHSDDIIRIFADDGSCDWKRPVVDASLYSVKDECSYGFMDWDKILDMEIRIEDNLTLTDADVVAVTIWEACDNWPLTEGAIEKFFNRLDEQTKTIDENKSDFHGLE